MSDLDLESVFAAVSSPYVLVDRDLRMLWANQAYMTVTGRTREQLIGRIMTEEFPAEPDSVSDQMLRQSLARAFDTGITDHLPLIPYPIQNADGTLVTRYWSASHAPIRGADGKVAYVLQNTNDVTDLYDEIKSAGSGEVGPKSDLLRRAEEVSIRNLELGNATQFFQTIFDQAPGFMAVTTGQEHAFKIVNEAYSDLCGQRELVGLGVREALPELADQGFFELLDKVYETGKPIGLNGAEAILTERGGAQTRVYADFVYQPLRDRTGKVIGIFTQGHDVTSKVLAERALAEAEERFRTMAQSMPSPVWTALPDGQLDWLSDRFYEVTGHAQGTLFGDGWRQLLHPDESAEVIAAWDRTIAATRDFEAELRLKVADGSFRWHLVRAAVVQDPSGRIVRWVGTNTDIHDRKLAEAALADLNATLEERVQARNKELEAVHAALRQSQKMEAIGTLAGGVAHDFNNLLQAITGSLELASKDMAEGSAEHRRIEQAMTAVGRGARLASQLLSFSRRQPLSPRPVDLGALIEESQPILRSALGAGIELRLESAPDLWNTLVDPASMENALLNLAVNARDAMEGMGRLTIEASNVRLDEEYARTHTDAAAGEHVMLTVSDTGPGMSADVIERAIEPFFSTKSDGRGTGLGLPMVYGFTTQSGGHMRLESPPGSGAVVRIYLPRTVRPALESAPAVIRTGARGGHETILLVEDDEIVRATVLSQLHDLGYRVLEAQDADEGLVIVDSDAHIDLILTDVVMPGRLTSRELAAHALKVRPGLPVLFSSGYTRDAMLHDGRLEEGVQLLSKPYSRETLAAKLREMLDGADGAPAASPPSDHSAGRESGNGAAPWSPTGKGPSEDQAQANPEESQSGMRILVCEDDALICLDLAEMSATRGAKVEMANNGRDAIRILDRDGADLLLVDLGLPDMSGLEVAQRAVEINPDIAILFATGQHDLPELSGFARAGLLTKPFGEKMLHRQIDALLR
ncbi:hybrid sensor histidine kinase/response regulator [Brevirhabdus pacifica]|uniref:histidine kinase n=1 Tax=Brevirhabdus pacifica TaxID=1267768 RepID=A0A1U7DIW6_9RHOB|nr:PAS domain S-box protein [Brevirhabdus pacifica]APX89934.1 hybrid sensor histidine kinase/response regulator [Brevirhabdus pacifica]PJJ82836.1 PAS domain S-box-containing protein [Brevirhabdus pacifica]